MKVSVVIPAFNAAETIAETLQSLLAQTFTDWEAIVVNDGSTDSTVAVVEEFMAQDTRIRLFSQANQGLSGARNSGLKLAQSDWLFFLDADDWIFPQHLQRLTSRLTADPSLDVVYCGWAYALPDGDYVFPQIPGLFGDLFIPFAQYCVSVVHTFVVRRSLVDILGPFDTTMRSCEDWALWQRIARYGARFGIVPEVLVAYRTRPNSLSRNGARLLQDGTEVLTRGHGLDPRVPKPHPVYPRGLPREQLTEHKFYLLCACAGYLIGGGKDARSLLEALAGEHWPTLLPYDVANCILIHALVSASRPRQEWYAVWLACQQNFKAFLIALEAHSGSPRLAQQANGIAGQLLKKYARGQRASRRIGTIWANLVLPKRSTSLVVNNMKQLIKRAAWTVALMLPPLRSTTHRVRQWLLPSRSIEAAHPSNNPEEHFEQLFTDHPDPWSYTNAYEQAKYEQTLTMIPESAKGEVLELACAEGHFTVQFAPQVKSLLTTDISQTALDRCQTRCAEFSNVRFQCLDFMQEPIPGCYDLIVCSEVLYFAGDRGKLRPIVAKIASALKPGGYFITTHSNVLVDDPKQPGFDWGHAFGAKFIGESFSSCQALKFVKELQTPLYRIQLFRRNSAKPQFARAQAPQQVQSIESINYEHLPPDILQDVVFTPTERLPVLVYPRISLLENGSPSSHSIPPDLLETQIQYLHKAGYHSISLDEWGYSQMSGTVVHDRAIVLVFEHSSQDFLDYAWPLLKCYGFSATLCLYADEIGQRQTIDSSTGQEIPLIEWAQIRQLQAEGVTFASHATKRRSLTSLSWAEAEKEMRQSRNILQQELAIPISTLVYPEGQSNLPLQYLAGLAGYDFAITGQSGFCTKNQSLLALPRIQINNADHLETFAAKIMTSNQLKSTS